MPMPTVSETLKIAAAEVGYNRYEDPEQGTKYGRWYATLTKSPYFGTTGVPYCAMFVSWVFNKTGVQCKGFPTASCTSALLKPAWNGGYLIRCANLKPGDAILFDWAGRGWQGENADHVGIVKENHGTYLITIEGNVSGCVKQCTRYPYQVVGGIRPSNYTTEPALKSLPLTKKGDKGDAVAVIQYLLQLRGIVKFGVVDGVFGDKTEKAVKEFQRIRGIGQDGMVGAKTWPALTSEK